MKMKMLILIIIVVISGCKKSLDPFAALAPYNYIPPTSLLSIEKDYGQKFDLSAKSKNVLQAERARDAYTPEYLNRTNHKAFAQSNGGASGWSYNHVTVESAISNALKSCHKYARGGYCRIINVDGMWAEDFLRSEIDATQPQVATVPVTQDATLSNYNVPKGTTFLYEDVIESIFVGNTVYGNFPRTNNSNWIEHYLSDGRLVYKSSTDLIQYGKWRIENDLFCTRYISDDSGDEWCHKIYKDNGKYNFVATRGEWKGTISSVVNYLKNGNPEGFIAND
jgi:hypothetical protein